MGSDVFEGLDGIDWRSMHHAYESAWNVPTAIRGLVSRNADKRAWAHDYMWGAVHHQGDVYDCTVAAIPFLIEAAAKPKARGRGQVVKLLASIGGADREGPKDLPDGPMRENVLRAQRAVAEALPLFVTLLVDAKPKVRAAAAGALLACPDRVAQAVPVLVVRVAQEPEKGVRNALIETLCTIAERADKGWLTGVDVPRAAGVVRDDGHRRPPGRTCGSRRSPRGCVPCRTMSATRCRSSWICWRRPTPTCAP
jgi:hypothetical protein